MNNKYKICIHAAVWTVMFISPLMFMNHGAGTSWHQFLFMSAVPMSLMIVFYVNYLWLTPKYFATENKQIYWLANIAMILSIGIALHLWMGQTHAMFDNRPPQRPPSPIMYVFFLLRDMFNLAISAAIATTIQLAMRWQESENARREAESARVNAELKNLRSQVNPHFLLNTLNNIYALTELAPDKAKEAILELSKLLRHILYDNQQRYVDLKSEVQFLMNYTNLMKIRLSSNVDLQFTADIPDPCNIMIAPLIFISLIENAFKHGVSTTEKSYIRIQIKATDHYITCDIVNSNFPKGDKDRSGHGIGLSLVARRLDLIYPNMYEWKKGVDPTGKEYSSKITIYDTKMCNN